MEGVRRKTNFFNLNNKKKYKFAMQQYMFKVPYKVL